MPLHKSHKKTLITAISATLLAGGMTLATTAQADLQGLYSADELLDADVYSNADNAKPIGEVEDILLDDDMRVHALVIETGNLLDMGEKQYVIESGNFNVAALNSDSLDQLEYRVTVDLSEQAITEQPAYTDNWWSETKQNARDAWKKTKEGGSSAWEKTKEGTANAWEKTKEGTAGVLDRAEDALNSSNDGTTTKK